MPYSPPEIAFDPAEWLSAGQIASLAQRSVTWVDQAWTSNRLPFVRFPDRRRYSHRSEVADFLARRDGLLDRSA